MSDQSPWHKKLSPNDRFNRRAKQAFDVLIAAKKALTEPEIRKLIVGCTSDNDEWELAVGLSRLVGTGIVTVGRLKGGGRTYEISVLQRLAMESK